MGRRRKRKTVKRWRLSIDPNVTRAIVALAREEGVTLTFYTEEILREHLGLPTQREALAEALALSASLPEEERRDAVCDRLEISRTTLYRRLKRHGMRI